MSKYRSILSALALICSIFSVAHAARSKTSSQDAMSFIAELEPRLWSLANEYSRADWVASTFITPDTEIILSKAAERYKSAVAEAATASTGYELKNLSPELARKMELLKVSTLLPPSDPKAAESLFQTITSMSTLYGKGKYCRTGNNCMNLDKITQTMATSHDPQELLAVWKGWHDVGRDIMPLFTRYIELANRGAKEHGYSNQGELWRSSYDMPPDRFSAEVDRLWDQVKPLYLSLHAYVRLKLSERYGAKLVSPTRPLPAHLLGNVWAQDWANIFPLIVPADLDPGFDLTKILKERQLKPEEMVRLGERFFVSLGFDPLPKSFWERSMFERPVGRDVICHATTSDIDGRGEVRIKMCLDQTAEMFKTVHHELGHAFYMREYKNLPFMFHRGANGAFHEAVGDAIALSITPEYLRTIGLLKEVPPPSKDVGLLLRQALTKVAFLPFGAVVDQWRWKVFAGEIKPSQYNQAWWDLRLKYQGIEPPVPREPIDFDPGAKFHVTANMPYMDYFLSYILQFQFHRALARAAGCNQPLHRCTAYQSSSAGKKLREMLRLGASQKWPEALKQISGDTQFDASALREYFAPLEDWLNEQLKGQEIGWQK